MQTRSQGFTLTELMITLTIAAIILAVATPSFTTFRQNNRLTGVANDLLGTMQTARTEAIKRQLPVSVCPSANPDSGAPTCNDLGNFTGWIAFVDANSDCQRTGAALPDGTLETNAANLIRTGGPIDTAVTVASSGTCISFAPTGFLQAAGHVSANFTFFWDDAFLSPKCGAQPGAAAQSRAREIEVTNTGRSRSTRVLAEVTAALAAAGVACP